MTQTQRRYTTIECGQCGGYYFPQPEGSLILIGAPVAWVCEDCGHNISLWDVELESDERLTVAPDGALAYYVED